MTVLTRIKKDGSSVRPHHDPTPLTDYQRDMLGDNLKLFYMAMNQRKLSKYVDDELGLEVLAYVVKCMRNYHPSLCKVSTFIFRSVDFALRKSRKRYREDMLKHTYAVSSFGDDRMMMQLIDPKAPDLNRKDPMLVEELERSLKLINPNQSRAIRLYYCDHHTVISGGELMGVSRQRFQQLVQQGIARLKVVMARYKDRR